MPQGGLFRVQGGREPWGKVENLGRGGGTPRGGEGLREGKGHVFIIDPSTPSRRE